MISKSTRWQTDYDFSRGVNCTKLLAEDAKLEMGELIDSDPELYGGDNEAKKSGKRRDMIGNNHDLSSQHDLMRGGGGDPWDCLYDSDDNNSLIDPEE